MEVACNFIQADSWAESEMAERMKWLCENEPILS